MLLYLIIIVNFRFLNKIMIDTKKILIKERQSVLPDNFSAIKI